MSVSTPTVVRPTSPNGCVRVTSSIVWRWKHELGQRPPAAMGVGVREHAWVRPSVRSVDRVVLARDLKIVRSYNSHPRARTVPIRTCFEGAALGELQVEVG